MSNAQDPFPENEFNPYEALRQLDSLDDAKRTGLERCMVVDEATGLGVDILDRTVLAMREPETDEAAVINLDEYREKRMMRREARQAVDKYAMPASPDQQGKKENPLFDHIAKMEAEVKRIRAQQDDDHRKAA